MPFHRVSFGRDYGRQVKKPQPSPKPPGQVRWWPNQQGPYSTGAPKLCNLPRSSACPIKHHLSAAELLSTNTRTHQRSYPTRGRHRHSPVGSRQFNATGNTGHNPPSIAGVPSGKRGETGPCSRSAQSATGRLFAVGISWHHLAPSPPKNSPTQSGPDAQKPRPAPVRLRANQR